MARHAHFFLSRIIKLGKLDVHGVVDALQSSPSIQSRGFAWTVVDVTSGVTIHGGKEYRYIAGKLAKYDPDALVEVIDATSRKVRLQSEPNLQRASSLFVYIPDEAVFGHRYLWNQLRAADFRTQMKALVDEFHRGFFAECELQPIADLSRFLTKLTELDEITDIKATVSPPNPLFGVYWQNLKNYLQERRLQKMSIREAAKTGDVIASRTLDVARTIEGESEENAVPAPIGDAAVLMAADGYGRAEITGRRKTEVVVVKTAQNAVQLKLDATVAPPELAAAVVREIVRINGKRRLKH